MSIATVIVAALVASQSPMLPDQSNAAEAAYRTGHEAYAQASRARRKAAPPRERQPASSDVPITRTDPDPNIRAYLNRMPPGSQW
jgi:hypothetical protein